MSYASAIRSTFHVLGATGVPLVRIAELNKDPFRANAADLAKAQAAIAHARICLDQAEAALAPALALSETALTGNLNHELRVERPSGS